MKLKNGVCWHTDIKNQRMNLNNGDNHKYLDKQINSNITEKKLTAKNKSKYLESKKILG